jgi:hypothetical protein
MAETGSLKLFENRPGPVQGKCCLKNVEDFDLTLFWYSPTYPHQAIIPDRMKIGGKVTCDIII